MVFTEVLTLVFIILRLIGKIDWPWYIIGLPEEIAFGFYILVGVPLVIAGLRHLHD